MRALLLKEPGSLEVEEIPESDPRPGEARIRIDSAGICGSDLERYTGFRAVKLPLVLGHEFAGTIEAIEGGDDHPFRPGDRVVGEPIVGCGACRSCRAGSYNVCARRTILGAEVDGVFARSVALPLRNLLKMPEGMPFEEAALVQPAAVTVHALRRTSFRAGCTAAVLGAGPIGALLAMTARAAGGTTVVLTEPNPFRRALMERMGFPVIDPAREDPVAAALALLNEGDEGFDLVFDAAGAADTLSQAVRMVRVRGEVALIAKYRDPPRVDTNEAQKREVNFFTARAHTFDDFRAALALVATRQMDVRPLVTHRLGLEEMPGAFHSLLERGPMMKVLCRP